MRTVKMQKIEKDIPIPRTFVAVEYVEGGMVVVEASAIVGYLPHSTENMKHLDISRHLEMHKNLSSFLHEKTVEGYRVYFDSANRLDKLHSHF